MAAQHNTTGAEANQQLSYGSLRTPCSRVASKVVDKKEPKREREREREGKVDIKTAFKIHLATGSVPPCSL